MARAFVCAILAAVLLGATVSGTAWAGAWTLPAGEGLAIAEGAALRSHERRDADRSAVDAPAFNKREGRVLLEYGLADRLTVTARAAHESWRQGEPHPDRWSGVAVWQAGARLRLLERSGFVGSVESSVRLAESRGSGPAVEYEGRLLLGRGFAVHGRPAFVDGGLGYRLRPEAATDEVTLDLTAGFRPRDRVLLLLQSFSTLAATPGEDGWPIYDHHKVQASVVFDLDERWSLQIGGGGTVAGSNARVERSALAALWLRF